MDSRDRVRLQHMLDAAQEALTLARDKSHADVTSDRMLALALVACLSIVGEAAGQVSLETRQEFPAIPWGDVIGMRNQLVHEYFRIDYDIVWQTVKEDVPSLVAALEQGDL